MCVSHPVSLRMVKRQLCTPEHLMNTEFGRPFPRHGLQLLFWFANHCVTCEFSNVVVIIKVPETVLFAASVVVLIIVPSISLM